MVAGRAVLVLLVTCLLLGPSPARSEDDEWVRPYEAFLPGTEPTDERGRKTVVSLRVLDELGTTPVAGARVAVYEECGGPEVLRPALLAEVLGDECGFANVVGPLPTGQKWHVDAPGYGIAYEFGDFESFDEEEIRLDRAVDHRFRVLDPYGRPLVGAPVELYLGCPHSPAAREGVTDGNGEILLSGIAGPWGHLWIRAEGVWCGPYDVPERHLGQDMPVLATDPGRSARGVVVDEDGEPLPGVIVRALGYRRGPVTTTDGQGRFALHGIWWRTAVGFFRKDMPFGNRPSATVERFEQDVPLRVVLKRDRITALADGEPRHVADVVVVRKDEFYGERNVEVRLVRLSDGLSLSGVTGRNWIAGGDEMGRVAFHVPAGRYRISTGGLFRMEREVVMTADLPRVGGSAVRLVLGGEQSVVVVRGISDDGDTSVELRTPGGTRELRPTKGRASAYVAGDVPASVLVRGRRDRLFPVPSATGETRVVTLPPDPPTVIVFRAVGPDGRPVSEGHGEIDVYGDRAPFGPDGWTEIRTWEAGPRELELHALDPDLELVSIPIDLPFTPERIELGEIRLSAFSEDEENAPLRSARLLTAEGEPVPDDVFYVGRVRGAGLDDVLRIEGGRIRWRPSPTPITVRLRGDPWSGGPWYPMEIVLSNETPAEIRLPGGRLTGTVRDTSGRPLSAALYVGTVSFQVKEGRLDVRGLRAGPHVVVLGARGHRGEVRRIVLTKGEARALDVVLPPRR
jgi:hypothetical protein